MPHAHTRRPDGARSGINADFTLNKPFFLSPAPKGRRITAGFSYIQRIGKSASIDLWFPDEVRRRLDTLLVRGQALGNNDFPAQWAAVRQFELLQEGKNYKIYDLDAMHITRSMVHLARDMRAGGYRITVASLGGYGPESGADDLRILDIRLQDRLSQLIRMLYLEQQSADISARHKRDLTSGTWDYRNALPHVGASLGARDLFKPAAKKGAVCATLDTVIPASLSVTIEGWTGDGGVTCAVSEVDFQQVSARPQAGQYSVAHGIYHFNAADCGRAITIAYHTGDRSTDGVKAAASERRHKLARQFFDVLSLLPHSHIVHDTAIGLQLPENIAENEWIYVSPGDETLGEFNNLLQNLFAPFNRVSLSGLHGREGATREEKATAQHPRSYGDRLTPASESFYRGLAQYGL